MHFTLLLGYFSGLEENVLPVLKLIYVHFSAPGTETNMALKAMHFTRQPPVDMLFYMQPYATNCTSIYPPSQDFLKSQGMKYSQSECKKSCLVHYVKGKSPGVPLHRITSQYS